MCQPVAYLLRSDRTQKDLFNIMSIFNPKNFNHRDDLAHACDSVGKLRRIPFLASMQNKTLLLK